MQLHVATNDEAQRPGARDATIATATLSPGSLERMVELSRFAAGVALTRGAAVSATESALDWPADLAHTWLGSWTWLEGHFR